MRSKGPRPLRQSSRANVDAHPNGTPLRTASTRSPPLASWRTPHQRKDLGAPHRTRLNRDNPQMASLERRKKKTEPSSRFPPPWRGNVSGKHVTRKNIDTVCAVPGTGAKLTAPAAPDNRLRDFIPIGLDTSSAACSSQRVRRADGERKHRNMNVDQDEKDSTSYTPRPKIATTNGLGTTARTTR